MKIVLADRRTALAAAFSTGTHLVIYKPISADRLRSSLRALSTLIGRRHPREFDRIQVRVPTIVQIAGKNLPASIPDISQGGAALLAKEVIPAVKTLGLEFTLPGRTGMITTSGEVMWNDVRGRIGLQFVNPDPASPKVICEWVAAQLSSKRLRKAVVGSPQA